MEYQDLDLGEDIREFRVVAPPARLSPVLDGGLVLLMLLGVYVSTLALSVVALVVLVARVYSVLFRVKQESLLVMRDLGVQLRTVYNSGRVVRTFIDRENILDIIINEGITGCRILYYLAVVVKGEKRMSVVFSNLYPPFSTVLQVYQSSKEVLCIP